MKQFNLIPNSFTKHGYSALTSLIMKMRDIIDIIHEKQENGFLFSPGISLLPSSMLSYTQDLLATILPHISGSCSKDYNNSNRVILGRLAAKKLNAIISLYLN